MEDPGDDIYPDDKCWLDPCIQRSALDLRYLLSSPSRADLALPTYRYDGKVIVVSADAYDPVPSLGIRVSIRQMHSRNEGT
jgi:hypothetical protein